jgi:hypothetical protein
MLGCGRRAGGVFFAKALVSAGVACGTVTWGTGSVKNIKPSRANIRRPERLLFVLVVVPVS